MRKKIALIFGVTGQDGSYLAKFLLKKKYEVHGVKRRSSSINTSRVDDIYENPFIKNKKFYMTTFSNNYIYIKKYFENITTIKYN